MNTDQRRTNNIFHSCYVYWHKLIEIHVERCFANVCTHASLYVSLPDLHVCISCHVFILKALSKCQYDMLIWFKRMLCKQLEHVCEINVSLLKIPYTTKWRLMSLLVPSHL